MPSKSTRREILRFGLAGMGTLSLPQLWRLRASQGAESSTPTHSGSNRPAIILVWLRGGCSHLDTYDPKPKSPVDYRGIFKPIETSVPGISLSELFPQQAKLAHRFTLLRSMAHTGGGHPAGSLQVLSGDRDAAAKPGPKYPDWMSVANFLRSEGHRALPNYIGVNPVTQYDGFKIAGSAYLGPSYDPFSVMGDPSRPEFKVPNIGLSDSAMTARLADRVLLRQRLDRLRREIDRSGAMSAVDAFEAQALTLLTSPDAATAFDLTREPLAVRERYGLNAWGQQCLLARRLVEAGVEIVTTTFDGPLCGRVANWDDHAVNHHIFEALAFRAPTVDTAVSALIEDIYERGLDRRVMVVVTGEFGRTPRITHVASSGGGVASAAAGTVQPGRDHWPRANTMLFAGGGIETGKVIGATDARGEDVVEALAGPHDFLATLYRHLEIDFANVAIPDHAGRPTPIVDNGSPIKGLERAYA